MGRLFGVGRTFFRMQFLLPMVRRSVAYETIEAAPGTSTHGLFRSRGTITAKSVSQVPEKELVAFATSRAEFRNVLGDALGVGREPCWLREMGPPLAAPRGDKPGDIDLLLAPHARPDLARAIEFKRVVIRQTDDHAEQVNKAEGIAAGSTTALATMVAVPAWRAWINPASESTSATAVSLDSQRTSVLDGPVHDPTVTVARRVSPGCNEADAGLSWTPPTAAQLLSTRVIS
jgi:hypothetical protein